MTESFRHVFLTLKQKNCRSRIYLLKGLVMGSFRNEPARRKRAAEIGAIMRILITGNMGYVGPVLTKFFRVRLQDAELIGFDTAYFAHSLTGAGILPEAMLDRQVFGDVREFPAELLDGVDAVVHLSAISNDPMGNKFEAVTGEINRDATVRLARLAAERRVKSFVFASSCSMYGYAEGGARKESDTSNPLTAYARSKIGSEKAFAELDLGGMTVTSLRFATACGMSDRLRLDLVLNDFVACAITSGEITVLSDGTPWRPLIDVEDMARAIAWAIARKPEVGGKFLAVNAGRDDSNYQVRDLANAVARQVPGTAVSINTNAPPDKRSYRVDFALFRSLAPDSIPQVSLDQSITRLREGLISMGFADKDFRLSPYMRLKSLERQMAAGRLGSDLRWRFRSRAVGTVDSAIPKTPLEGAYPIEVDKLATIAAPSLGSFARASSDGMVSKDIKPFLSVAEELSRTRRIVCGVTGGVRRSSGTTAFGAGIDRCEPFTKSGFDRVGVGGDQRVLGG